MITRAQVVTTILLLGIMIGILVRVSFPEADPPLTRQTGAPYWDEGWAHEARNGYLWGSWKQDRWRTSLISPTYTLVTQSSFEMLGLSYTSLRLPAILAGTALLILAFLQARAAAFSRAAALFACFGLATSWAMTGFSKVAIIEPILLLGLSTTLLFVLLAERRRSLWLYALAGATAGLSMLTKLSATAFLAGIALYLTLGRVADSGARPIFWRTMRSLWFATGAVVAVALGGRYWIWPDFDDFRELAIGYYVARNMRGPSAVLWNVFDLLGSQAFLSTPFWFAAVLLFLPAVLWANRPCDVGLEMRSFTIQLAVGISVVGCAVSVLADVPARRLIWMNIPVALLAAGLWDTLREKGSNRLLHDQIDERKWTTVRHLVTLGCATLSAYILVKWVISPHGGLLAMVNPASAARVALTSGSLLPVARLQVVLGLMGGVLLCLSWKFLVRHGSVLLRVLALVQFVIYLGLSSHWVSKRTYSIRNASVELGRLVGRGEPVLGNWASFLAYENDTRPIFWSPGIAYANQDEDEIIRRYGPRFLLLEATELSEARMATLSPYVKSFLTKEVARFRLYEVQSSDRLIGECILFERATARAALSTSARVSRPEGGPGL